MSLYDYTVARSLVVGDPPFYALIMAAMWGADSQNATLLREAFPETWDELQTRYNYPGGVLAGESR